MNMMVRVQILVKAICIAHNANSFEKGMYPAMGRLGSLILVWQPVKEKEKSQFKSA